MNERLKKMVMLLVSVSVLLVACQSSSEETSEISEGVERAEVSQEVKNTKSDRKIEIEYWHVNADTLGGKTVDELVEKFNSSQEEIEVTARYNPDMYKGLMQNLQAEQASGNSPAVVQVGWAFLDYFSNNFEYQSPVDIINNHDNGESNYLSETFLENILKLAENSDGVQVGLPYSLSTPVLYINKDILREAGLDENGPETWQEVKEFAKEIKDKTGNYGIYIQEPADFWAQQALIESNGGQIISQDNKAAFASSEGVEAMQIYADMVLEDESAVHISWDEGMQSFVDGSIGMCYTTIARRAQIQENAKFDAASIKSPIYEGKERQVPAGGCFLAVTATEENEIKAAWEFTKFLYEIENSAAWTIGTGYVPPRLGVSESEEGLKSFLEENKMMVAAIDQMEGVVPWASFPGDVGLQAEQALLDMRDQILGGQSNVEDAMKNAQDSINDLL